MILKDKYIIVSGGSGILGSAIIDEIKAEGGIAINLDISVKNNVDHCYHFDLTEENYISKLNQILINYDRIDGLVNAAYPRTDDWGKKPEDVTEPSFKVNIEWQLNSVFFIIKEVVEKMKKKSSGSVVNIASIYGMVGNDFNIYKNTSLNPPIAYSAIKGGLINMNRYLASYFSKFNLRFNCVSPGGILNNQDPIFVENYNKKVPLGRMGDPIDIAPAVCFLLSDKSSYITGQNIAIDGGWTAI
jgi:NAD(P)-dependent dehydrogenase (short-subunit alcohol dehydrogenase family)